MTNIEKKWKDFLNESQFDYELLKPKDKLHPSFWREKKLNTRVLRKLMEIAQDVIDSMSIKAHIKDVTITGSIASFNWHNLSDIDLHIVLDFREIDSNTQLVKKMLDQSRINWNKVHNIMISSHECELYFQDINEKHEAVGVYSILEGTWIQEPTRINTNIDLQSTEKKAEAIAGSVDHLFDLFSDKRYDEAYNYASKIKNKIKKMRHGGLNREGVYSVENLAFKMLRNAGILQKLSSLKVNAYDKMMSMELS
jgi:predicted nucleotidyltransferase